MVDPFDAPRPKARWFLAPAFLPLLGTLLGGVLAITSGVISGMVTSKYQATEIAKQREWDLQQSRKQRHIENLERTYTRLNGLKAALNQTNTTRMFAQLSAALNLIAASILQPRDQYVQAERDARAREQEMLTRHGDLIRDLYEALGEVRIVFNMTEALKTKVDRIQAIRPAALKLPMVHSIKSALELAQTEKTLAAEIPRLMAETLLMPFDDLLPLLLEQVLAARAAQASAR